MSDSKRPLGDSSKDSDYSEDYGPVSVSFGKDKVNKGVLNPLDRLTDASAKSVGVFVVKNKNLSALSPEMNVIFNRKIGSGKVGPEIGPSRNAKEIAQEKAKMEHLGFLTTQAGIDITLNSDESLTINLPPELRTGKKEIEEVEGRLKNLERSIPLVARFARLQGRADIIAATTPLSKEMEYEIQKLDAFIKKSNEEETFSSTYSLIEQDLDNLETALSSLTEKKEEIKEQGNETVSDSKAEENEEEGHENVVTQENISLIKERGELYQSFETLQKALADVLEKVTDDDLFDSLEASQATLLSIKKKLDTTLSEELVTEFKQALGTCITTLEQATTSISNVTKEEPGVSSEATKETEEVPAEEGVADEPLTTKEEADRTQEEIERVAKEEETKKKAKEKEEKDKEEAKKKREGEQKKERLLFEEENKNLVQIETLRDSFLNELTSPLEKEMLVRRFSELNNKKKVIETMFANGEEVNDAAINEYKEEIAAVHEILVAIENRLNALYGLKNKKGVLRSPSSNQKATVTLRTGKKIPAESWQRDQVKQQEIFRSEADVERKRGEEDLLKLHRGMFTRNKEDYIKNYLHKKWVDGDPNKKAAERILEDYHDSLVRTMEAVVFDRKAHERELKEASDSNRKTILGIEIKGLEQQEAEIKKEIDGLKNAPEEIILKSIHGDSVYSANKKEPSKPVTPKDITPRKEPEIRTIPTSSVPENTHTPLEATPPVTRPSEAPQTTTSPEQAKKKFMAVNKLFDTLSVERIKKFGKSWKVFAVVAAALYGAGYFGAAHSKEKEVRGPLTLEQAVSWKDFLKTNEEIQSLKDLVGKDELGFVNFMKKYAPLANLDTNNPSTIEALSTMECVKLLNSPEIVYGLNDEQRQQVCNVVRKLEKLIQATEAGKNMSPTFTHQAFAYTNPKTTITQLYDMAREAVAKAELLEASKKK